MTRSAANTNADIHAPQADVSTSTINPPQAQSEAVVNGSVSNPDHVKKEKKSKKRKHAEVDQENTQPTTAAQDDVDMKDDTQKEEKAKKKKKKSKDEKATSMDAVDSEDHDLPKADPSGDTESPEHVKPSKKRKREVSDEGGKDLIEGVENLSFKERCRVEKKARKAEKAAKKAERMKILEELNSQTP
jgi:hypothetical protein